MPPYERGGPRFVGPGYSLAWYILGCSQCVVSRRWRSARIGYSHGWFLQAFSICMQPQLPSTIKKLNVTCRAWTDPLWYKKCDPKNTTSLTGDPTYLVWSKRQLTSIAPKNVTWLTGDPNWSFGCLDFQQPFWSTLSPIWSLFNFILCKNTIFSPCT